MSVTWLVDNPRVHAELIEIEPGATMPLHTHVRPQLVVILNDLTLESDAGAKGKTMLVKKTGDVDQAAAGLTHTLKNVGTRPARFVAIEIK